MAADTANDNSNGKSEPRMTRMNADRTGRAESDGAPGPMFSWGDKASLERQGEPSHT